VKVNPEAKSNTLAMRRAGWIMSGIVIAFLIGDAGATLLAIEPIRRAMLEVGYSHDLMRTIGALQLICLVLYAIPATSGIGAIVLTGFLGGAIASHLRVAGGLTPEIIVSIALGLLAWGGLWFRDPPFRALIARRVSAD